MKLHTINTGMFKLDGGAMFGVVPKSIWNKLNPADDNNMCSWAMRCLLIEDGKRLILIDTGMGDKQNEKFFGYYFLHGNYSLHQSLNEKGLNADDITDVFLTHLHFDHCGGSIQWNSSRDGYEPVFKNATYWSHSEHWQWATQPNAREKASFLKENILPIQESGQLKFADKEADFPSFFSFETVSGHTESMMLPLINYNGKKIMFVADLFPSIGHLPLPYVMAYDTRPLLTLNDKAQVLKMATEQNISFFFEHDPVTECCTILQTDKGIVKDTLFKLSEL